MVKVIRTDRKSPVLTPSSLACLARIPTVNLTAGCAHGCLYCYTRGYRSHPGDGRIILYTNTLEKLRDELHKKRKKPNAVYFCPASDLFQPVAEVLDLAFEILNFLLSCGIGVAFLTKGVIPQRHFLRLARDPGLVRGQIGLITTNQQITDALEPNAATPDVRLAQIRQLVAAGIKTQVRLDPILPGLTDDAESIENILSAAAETGATNIAVSALFLRPAVVHSIKKSLRDVPMRNRLLDAYGSRERLAIHAGNSRVVALPAERRLRVYDRVKSIAHRLGLRVRTCGCKNPDLSSESCSIAGEFSPLRSTMKQRNLFAQNERE